MVTGRLGPGPGGSGGWCIKPGQDVLDRLALLLYCRELLGKAFDGVTEQPRLGDGSVEKACLVNVLHLCQVEPGMARESGCQLIGLERETRTVSPSGGVPWAQVHRDRSLHLGNARVPPGRPTVEGSDDGGGGRAASGRERGHPRLRQLLMHLREERHRVRAWL